MKKNALRTEILRYILITTGAFVYSIGQTVFIRSMNIPLGGVTGIALIINHLTGFPVGVMNLIINIPLLILGYRFLGKKFFVKTIYATILLSIFMDVSGLFLPKYQGDMLINALYGGIIMGIGTGLIYRQGGTGGGSDIVAKLINKKRDIQLGNFSLGLNVVIITLSSLVYKNLESALYAMITTFMLNTLVDKIVYVFDVQKKAMIITDYPKQVSEAVMHRLGKGVTAWSAKGMYHGKSRTVLLCAVHRHETGILKATLKEVDPKALLLLSELTEAFGMDFKKYDSQ